MRVIFVTDPICSWCWGTLREVEAVRTQFSSSIEFVLVMAGLQIGSGRPLTATETRRLQKTWTQVAETTNAHFSGQLPDNFIYHSELACRAVEVVRRQTNVEPWAFFHDLQRAFYVDARNPGDSATLTELALAHGVPAETMAAGLRDPDVIATTRAQFTWVEQQAASALPTLLTQQDQGPATLLCGGYVDAAYLEEALTTRMP